MECEGKGQGVGDKRKGMEGSRWGGRQEGKWKVMGTERKKEGQHTQLRQCCTATG